MEDDGGRGEPTGEETLHDETKSLILVSITCVGPTVVLLLDVGLRVQVLTDPSPLVTELRLITR